MSAPLEPPVTGQLLSRMIDQTLVLTLSNPGFRNALSPAMYAAGVEALLVASESNAVRSVILTGEGDVFCAGGNLQRLLYNRSQPREAQSNSIDQLHAWIDAIRSFPKPVVAAVEGPAAGAGCSLVLACDMVVAASDAAFAVSYVNVGLSPDGGASWQLAHQLPRQMASEMLMGGGKVDALRLHALGVVNRLCEKGQALATALAWCAELNAKAPNALESIKTLLTQAETADLQQHMLAEREQFVTHLHHANGGEGIQAFLDKRKPRFV